MQFNKVSPKVSVGMPVFNRAHVLRDTIQQVLDQTFTDFEFIICNDGSKDESADIVRSIRDDRIIFLDRPNQGPPHPLNEVLRIAKGEFIIILHDHDFFDPRLLEKSVNALEQYSKAGFVLQGSAWIDEDGRSDYREMLHNLPEINPGQKTGEELLLNNKSFSSIFHACCMVRRSAYEAVGKFYKTEFGLYADTDLWFRLLHQYDFVYLREVLFKFRTREVNGHFLTNREFEVLEWNCSIQRANIHHYFPNIVKQQSALMRLERRRKDHVLHLTIKYASTNNLVLFRKGMLKITDDRYQPTIRRVASNLIIKTRMEASVASLFFKLNKARKWVKQK